MAIKAKIKKQCDQCGKSFRSKTTRAKYCKPACRTAKSRENNRTVTQNDAQRETIKQPVMALQTALASVLTVALDQNTIVTLADAIARALGTGMRTTTETYQRTTTALLPSPEDDEDKPLITIKKDTSTDSANNFLNSLAMLNS